MKQFSTILKFELANYLRSKGFLIFTILLVVGMALLLFSPRYLPFLGELFTGDGDETTPSTSTSLLVHSETEDAETVYNYLVTQLQPLGYEVVSGDYSVEEMTALIDEQAYDRGLYLQSLTAYTSVVKDTQLGSADGVVIQEVLSSYYAVQTLSAYQVPATTITTVLTPPLEETVIQTGVNQSDNFFYTYALIMLLYIAILLYGQYVVSSVVVEKTSRAMEVLVTSARATSFMFAKVLSAGIAGLCQLTLVLGSAFLFFQLNASYWENDPIIQSLFNMPLWIIGLMLVFFLCGFFMYAFLFGAAGSLVNKLEDMNTVISPVMLCFIASFFITLFSMVSGNVDSIWMVVCSYIPLTSPLAMFARVAMSDVPAYEVAISVGILLLSIWFTGWIGGKIYRVGVLLYGNKPSLFAALKLVLTHK